MASPLMKGLRSRRNLWRAWFHVFPRAASSGHEQTRRDALAFKQDSAGNIEALQRRLASGSFEFEAQRGVARKRKGKSRRPIVVSPLQNRLVQRAILQTLQDPPSGSKRRLAEVTRLIETETSVGGLPKKGVPTAVKLIAGELSEGATHFYKSDIAGFFTSISKPLVIGLLSEKLDDPKFVEFFRRALEVELENVDEIKEWIELFPIGDDGVAQGSALSAFCGNLLLQKFDQSMNGRGRTTIRYIDDFVVLTRSDSDARRAMNDADALLRSVGLSLYDPDDRPDKAKIGSVSDGFEFLSYKFRGSEIAAADTAKQRLLSSIDKEISLAKKAIRKSKGEARRADERFVQALNLLDHRIRGWGDSFRYVTRRLEFVHLDNAISKKISSFERWFFSYRGNLTTRQDRQRALGVALLHDTPIEKVEHGQGE